MLKVKSTLTAMTQPEQNRRPLSPDQVSQQGRRRDLCVRPCSPLCWQAAKGPSLQFRTCNCSRVAHKSPKRVGFLTLLVAFIPRTTSERRISVVVSPCTLTADPGRGGKLEAARSNFGDSGAAAFIKGAGLCGVHHSRMRSEQVRCEGRFFPTPEPPQLKSTSLTVGCSSSLFRRVFLWLPLLWQGQLLQRETVHITQQNTSNWADSLTFQTREHSDLRWVFVL